MSKKTRRRAQRMQARLEKRVLQRIRRRAWSQLPKMNWEDDGGALHPKELED